MSESIPKITPELADRLRQEFLATYNQSLPDDAVFHAIVYDQRPTEAVRDTWARNGALSIYLDVTGVTFEQWFAEQLAHVDVWRASEADRIAKAERSRIELAESLARFDWTLLPWGVLNDVLLQSRKALPARSTPAK